MEKKVKRLILVVIDSVGCGDAPDAGEYGDEGSNTLGNTARAVGGLHLPNMGKLGLGHLADIEGVPPIELASGAYGRLTDSKPAKIPPQDTGNLAG
jgi:phosphopentomutase